MAGRISDRDIAEVRERTRIEEVVGEYVALRPAGGGSLKGLCPFHDEKSPSFNVRPAHGYYHCFGCGEGGDAIKFIQEVEHLSFVETVERLAERVGYTLTYEGGGTSVQRDRGTRSRLVAVNAAAQEFYAAQLREPEAEAARAYLTERSFDAAAAATFGCGYAPSGWDSLTKTLVRKGFEVSELIAAGVSKEGKRGPIDRFHRRLLWPLRNLGGDVVGFGARRLFDDDPIEAKYVNTSDTLLYKKSEVLFGLDLAKREIKKRHQAVIVEGYTDVMAMHLAGVPTAVATCGTAFGESHMELLRRLLMDDSYFRGEVVYTFDGDKAGQAAALKAFDGDQKFAAQTYVSVAPDGMDPCELRLASGDGAVRDLVARRSPMFAFAVKALLAEHDLDTAEGRVAALSRTVGVVGRIKDHSLRDEYARQLAGWVGWDETAAVVKRVRESAGQPAVPVRRRPVAVPEDADAGPARPEPRDPRLWPQREVLKAALQQPSIAGPVFDSLPEDVFSHPAYAALHAAVRAAGGTAAGLGGAQWVEAVSDVAGKPRVRSLVSELAVEPLRTTGDAERYVSAVLARLQEVWVGQQVAELKSKLQRVAPADDPEEHRALFGDLVALEQYRRTLLEQANGAEPEAI
ncbi:DNA primase [Rhodococcus antarcticus]|uniref:DNA primase n=1 Tax=Rhodococcus antarcticus TaxID=2987751 RepID=A0ABY6NXD2_9NOCA|nr:DNA primase [Rhodococcus antarcticus]UZJ23681.1 DNA primase [Rhodococcus antarcticus]